MWQWITENPVTLAALVNGSFTIGNGLLAAAIAFGGVALAQRRQNERDRQAYARKLRDDRRDRLRAACKLIMAYAWKVRGLVAEDEQAQLPIYSEEDKQGFYAKLERLEAAADEARSVVSVDVDSERIAEKNLAVRRVLEDYLQYVEQTQRGGAPGISIEELRGRSKAAITDLLLAIHEELHAHDEPV